MLASGPNARIERIISVGHVTPAGEWYDQATDEWVLLLQGEAELAFEGGDRQRLKRGDYLLIPAHCRHRVEATSTDPPCLWLAMHGKSLPLEFAFALAFGPGALDVGKE